VLLALHQIYPDAPLYTSVYSPKNAKWASVFPSIKTSFLQHIPLASTNHDKLALLMPIAFEQFNFGAYDLVISVTSEAAKGIITKPYTKHICYCLTPTRYLWSGYTDYFGTSINKTISQPFIGYLRLWDKMAAMRPDKMIAISKEVQERILKYYGRDSSLVYPPLSLNASPAVSRPLSVDYYLLVSRLVPYKRVDLAIKAFNSLGRRLVIIGRGSEERRLRRMACANIKFVSDLTDKELSRYYLRSQALVMPQVEDFGLVSVEAQAMGIPVIAYKRGGTLDSVVEGKTGVFFEEQNEESLIAAVKSFENMRFDKKTIRKNAAKFSLEAFKREFLRLVSK